MAASVRDVAAAAGVSVGTVSNVLNRPDRVAPATVARVQAAIEQLGFVRNAVARQLRAGCSRSVALIVLDLGNPFFAEVARGAEERAAAHGLSVLVGNSDDSADRQREYLDLFQEQRVRGVLATPASADLSDLRRLRDAGMPVVLVDADGREAGLPSVRVDDVEGGRLAARHLLQAGRRRLAFLGGPRTIRQVADRLAGATAAVAEVDGATLEVIETPALSVLAGRGAGAELAARAANGRPDAVFAANDLLAVGLLQSLTMQRRLRVPEDVALIGYDDIDFAATTIVPLSSIRQPARRIGSAAVDLLLRAVDGNRDPADSAVCYRPELVARASTAG